MNRKAQRLLIDMLIAIVLSCLLTALMNTLDSPWNLFLGLGPLIWLTFRQGGPAGILAAGLTGLVSAFIIKGDSQDLALLVARDVFPLLTVGLAGFFAKYTHKTLNNRRYSSTYLNLVTGTLVSTLAYYLLIYLVEIFILNQTPRLALNQVDFYLSWLLTAGLIGGILVLLARFAPKTIIPKYSKYLSRKETSSLLND